jgi:hypothetical protein
MIRSWQSHYSPNGVVLPAGAGRLTQPGIRKSARQAAAVCSTPNGV